MMHSADFRDRDHRAFVGWKSRVEVLGTSEPVTPVGAIDGAAGRHEGGCAEEVQILQKVSGIHASRQLGSTPQVEDGLRNLGAGGTVP